jgi:hypothetical protein
LRVDRYEHRPQLASAFAALRAGAGSRRSLAPTIPSCHPATLPTAAAPAVRPASASTCWCWLPCHCCAGGADRAWLTHRSPLPTRRASTTTPTRANERGMGLSTAPTSVATAAPHSRPYSSCRPKSFAKPRAASRSRPPAASLSHPRRTGTPRTYPQIPWITIPPPRSTPCRSRSPLACPPIEQRPPRAPARWPAGCGSKAFPASRHLSLHLAAAPDFARR